MLTMTFRHRCCQIRDISLPQNTSLNRGSTVDWQYYKLFDVMILHMHSVTRSMLCKLPSDFIYAKLSYYTLSVGDSIYLVRVNVMERASEFGYRCI